MTRRRRLALGLLIVAAVLLALFVVQAVRDSAPASPDAIRAAIAHAPEECRDLVAARIQDSIVRQGAVSTRGLDQISHGECRLAGPQLRAASEPVTITL